MSKTCYSIFTAQNKIIPGYLNSIKIGQNVINRTDTAKYLSIIIDEKLNWHAHIEQLTKDLVKISNSFKITKHCTHIKDKTKLYYLYIHSKIWYVIELYGQACETQINKV